jgi:hypothetical protein
MEVAAKPSKPITVNDYSCTSYMCGCWPYRHADSRSTEFAGRRPDSVSDGNDSSIVFLVNIDGLAIAVDAVTDPVTIAPVGTSGTSRASQRARVSWVRASAGD